MTNLSFTCVDMQITVPRESLLKREDSVFSFPFLVSYHLSSVVESDPYSICLRSGFGIRYHFTIIGDVLSGTVTGDLSLFLVKFLGKRSFPMLKVLFWAQVR
jgi:hypothetical protein